MVRVLFLHPDLGIGGAERLVVDAALVLKERGHDVSFLTNHHDPQHCFEETANGQLKVQVVGDWLPRKIFGRFYAFCAYLRMLYAAFYASFVLARTEKIDLCFCDQISVCIPVLRLAAQRPKIIFYCHFPDQLLSAREGLLKRLYRAPLNYFEEYTVGMADNILVNSKFTLRVFRETFQRLDVVPDVLYPSLNTNYFDKMQQAIKGSESIELPAGIPSNAFIYLDINRYERKKNHPLALKAFKKMGTMLPAGDWRRCLLVIAGGYDTRVEENVEHFEELKALAAELKIQEQVVFLRSPSDTGKFNLLHAAQCLIYTPANEHFGIVPLEGMYMSKPVIAVNSGGPTETVVHNSTGMLCEQAVDTFANAMLQLYKDNALRARMGTMGHMRVQQKFSFKAFGDKLDSIVKELLRPLRATEKKLK